MAELKYEGFENIELKDVDFNKYPQVKKNDSQRTDQMKPLAYEAHQVASQVTRNLVRERLKWIVGTAVLTIIGGLVIGGFLHDYEDMVPPLNGNGTESIIRAASTPIDSPIYILGMQESRCWTLGLQSWDFGGRFDLACSMGKR
ncbi:uncharacterized protein PAC_08638_fgumx [Phialocephala subalpina]|uniref:Uncharacterized protein n=1 Tax=Phialocephala subalpina TaxID=576137 RepID=A0A1L7WWW5_9HELO|nr:uncharacterized protein PAC_08638_fgumx [Phialocephala subalpina]